MLHLVGEGVIPLTVEDLGEGEGVGSGDDNKLVGFGLEWDLLEGDDDALLIQGTLPEVGPYVLHLGLLLRELPARYEESMNSFQVRAGLLDVSPCRY